MQFKHPEILYALCLLIIPVIVHLFQLRKFKKIAFTNVAFLKHVRTQTRKSSQIKKWLTLLTRLLLLASIIIAFAQPYRSKLSHYNTQHETVIYLDNSYSMQAKGTNGTLLNGAIQDLINNLDDRERVTLFTNTTSYTNTTIKALKNELISLKPTAEQLSLETVMIKAASAFSKATNTNKNLLLISDFQKKDPTFKFPTDSSYTLNIIPLKPITKGNVSIDSVFVVAAGVENLEIEVQLKNQGEAIETLPVSLYSDSLLIAKSSVAISNEASVVFSVPNNTELNGKVVIDDNQLLFDNTFYFNINKPEKINVLAINNTDDIYLQRLFTEDEFNYKSTLLNELDYKRIEVQNLIVLNELNTIPLSLTTALNMFVDNGGSLLIIPSGETSISAYNQLFKVLNTGVFTRPVTEEKRLTNINFSHPLLAQVFEKNVKNFQYPVFKTHYQFTGNKSLAVLHLEDGEPLLIGQSGTYLFTAPLNQSVTNFKQSPLIVPIFYNIAKQSLKLPQLYYTMGIAHTIEVPITLQQDDILKLGVAEQAHIPRQQKYATKVQLTLEDYPTTAGIYPLVHKNKVIKNLSFNYSRAESQLIYHNFENTQAFKSMPTTALALNNLKSEANVNDLWKWFVIFALAFAVIEMLILKFLK